MEIPIIFITGHGDIPMTVRAMKAGAVEFLTKPSGDGKDGSRLPGGIGPDGRPARYSYPKVVAAFTKV
jgi:PleD family two-component response regulator